MEIPTALIQLVVILLSARIAGEVAAYLQAPSVIGELTAGIILGPSLLGWIEMSTSIQLLAQIGIILLLFEVGLERDVRKLFAAGPKALIVALGGVILPFAFGYLLSFYYFDLSQITSFFIGGTLTATSIGITLRVLQDLQQQNSHEAQIILGAAVFDDIIGIVLLSVLYEFSSSGEVNVFNTEKILLFIVLFLLIAPIAAKGISQIIKKWEEKSDIPGLLPTTIVSLILFFAWIAHYLGAPELLGGFAAGLALSRQFPFANFLQLSKEFTHRVQKQMLPIIHLFTPIFFVAIGLSLNLKNVEWSSSFIWQVTSLILIAAIAGKLLSGFLLIRERPIDQLIIGTAMIPRGEVGLVFANMGLLYGIFKQDIYTAVILVIAITTLCTPFVLRWLYQYSARGRPVLRS